jgi:hypothetical protein
VCVDQQDKAINGHCCLTPRVAINPSKDGVSLVPTSDWNACGFIPLETLQAFAETAPPLAIHSLPIEKRVLRTARPIDHHITMCPACPIFRLAVAGSVV